MFVPEFFPIPLSFLTLIAVKLKFQYSIWASVGAGVVKQRSYAEQINDHLIWLELANAVVSRIYDPTEYIDAHAHHFFDTGSRHYPYPDELNSAKSLDFFAHYCEENFADRLEYREDRWGRQISAFKSENSFNLIQLEESNPDFGPLKQQRLALREVFWRDCSYKYDPLFKFLTLNAAGFENDCDWALFVEAIIEYYPRRDLYRAFHIPLLANQDLVAHFDHVAELAYLEMSDFSKIQEQDLIDITVREDCDIFLDRPSSERLDELRVWNSEKTDHGASLGVSSNKTSKQGSTDNG